MFNFIAMLIQKTYRIFAFIMAILILVSSSGLTMDMHFCEGKLKRINFLGKAKTCAEVSLLAKTCCNRLIKPSCHKAGKDHKGCCQNQGILLDMEFDFGDLLIIRSLLFKSGILSHFTTT